MNWGNYWDWTVVVMVGYRPGRHLPRWTPYTFIIQSILLWLSDSTVQCLLWPWACRGSSMHHKITQLRRGEFLHKNCQPSAWQTLLPCLRGNTAALAAYEILFVCQLGPSLSSQPMCDTLPITHQHVALCPLLTSMWHPADHLRTCGTPLATY